MNKEWEKKKAAQERELVCRRQGGERWKKKLFSSSLASAFPPFYNSFSSFSVLSSPPLFLLSTLLFFPHIPLAASLSSPPLLHLCVMSRSWGESTWDFPTARQDQTQPRTHSFSVSPSTPSVSCQRGVLRKTTPAPPPSILDVCWNFMLLVVPQTSTVCCYGDGIITRRLQDKNTTAFELKQCMLSNLELEKRY